MQETSPPSPAKKLHARHRRPLVVQSYLKGNSLDQIALEFDLSLAVIQKDIQHIFENELQDPSHTPKKKLAIEVYHLNRIENTAWQAYHEESDIRYLKIIQECCKYRIQILNLQVTQKDDDDNGIHTIHIVHDA